MILLAAVRDRLGDKAVRTGTAVTGFTERDGFVEVLLSSRPNGAVVPAAADVLIGADGLYSAVRAQLHPDEPPPRWNGVMLWRGISEGPPFLSGSCVAIAGSTTTVKFVAYPISRTDRGTMMINWVAEAMTGGSGGGPVPAARRRRCGRTGTGKGGSPRRWRTRARQPGPARRPGDRHGQRPRPRACGAAGGLPRHLTAGAHRPLTRCRSTLHSGQPRLLLAVITRQRTIRLAPVPPYQAQVIIVKVEHAVEVRLRRRPREPPKRRIASGTLRFAA